MTIQEAANALLTVEEFSIYTGDADQDTLPDKDQTQLLINLVSDILEDHLDRKLITPAANVDEIFDGTGSDRYYVRQGRILASPTPELFWLQADGTWGDALVSPSYLWTFDVESGRIYFTDGNKFSRGTGNWKISYSYGWTQATVPSVIKLAVFRSVHRLSQLAGGREGLRSESLGAAGSTTYSLDELIPADLMKRLERYSHAY